MLGERQSDGVFPMKVGLTGTARKLRSDTTDAEIRLWRALRNRRLSGYKFKRQVPFSPYIADFLCADAQLIVEADGGQHAESVDADRLRTEYFEQGGYRVLRFWNNDVLQNLEGVLETIARELGNRPPHPALSPRGEGEEAAALSPSEAEVRASSLPSGRETE